MDQRPTNIEQQTRVLQIITAAMAMGAIAFTTIGVLLAFNFEDREQDIGMLMSIVGAAGAAIQLVLTQIVPPLAARRAGDFINKFQTRHILTIALIEGAIFFNVVCYMIGNRWWTLAIVVSLIVWLLFQFPTVTRVRQWIETQEMNQQ